MQNLRKKIREIDEKILKLIAERLELAKEIGGVKQAESLPTKNFQVERDLLAVNRKVGDQLGLFPELTQDFTELMIRYSIETQERFRLSQNTLPSTASEHVVIVGGNGRMGRWFSDYFASLGHHVSIVDHKDSCGPYPKLASIEEACSVADVLVLATPLMNTPTTLELVIDIGTSGLVFDIASLKSPLAAAIAKAVKHGVSVGSIHPMFGPDAKLLSGRNILICDIEGGCPTQRLRSYFDETSARVSVIAIDDHDRIMNLVLGLSHLVNLIFADVLSKSKIEPSMVAKSASSTFSATMAVAEKVVQENESMYFDIQHYNKNAHEIHELLKISLEGYLNAIKGGHKETFEQAMVQSRSYFEAVARCL